MNTENDLIIEFMGIRYDGDNEILFIENPKEDYEIELNEILRTQTDARCNRFNINQYCRFDKSYDWLIPVIKKILFKKFGDTNGSMEFDIVKEYSNVIYVLKNYEI